MSAVPEDVTKEIAATSEPPGGRRTRMRLASEEFFFLLQRIDRLDEKLSGEIKSLENKLNGLVFWAIGTIVAVVVGFAGVIATLALS